MKPSVAAQPATRRKLGERLVASGVITPAQLDLVLKEQARTGGRLGEIVIALGFCTDQELTATLASQSGVDSVDLAGVSIAPDVLGLLTEEFCRRHTLIPIGRSENTIRVAMANAFDVLAVDAVSELTGLAVDVVAASEPALLEKLDRAFSDESGSSMGVLIEKALASVKSSRLSELVGGVEEQPVVRLVDTLIRECARLGATDIHIEPEARVVRTRLRVDGVLISGHTLPLELKSSVVARLKLLGDLDISESRLPQDGKAMLTVDRRPVNIRMSTLPTIHGENVVLRILDRGKVMLGLKDLGFSERNLQVFSQAIRRPSGIILVTGPTGSGKTTSLYAALATMNTMDRKIATLEDPVEYELPVIRQSQVNVAAGLTFASGLRALLRQDPDVILVGEMRDAETVEVALRAAMTGHLVLSTLHTNSALGAIPRLFNLGVEPVLAASTIVAIVAQRLVRRLCPDCRKADAAPDPLDCNVIGLAPSAGPYYAAGSGCTRCNGTGYRGRQAVAEVLYVTPAVAREIAAGTGLTKLAEVARAEGLVTMSSEARGMVQRGETSIAEAVRHVWDSELGMAGKGA